MDNPCSWDGSVREDTNLRERDILFLRCINVEVNIIKLCNQYKVVISVLVSVCMSDQNSRTPGPICLKL